MQTGYAVKGDAVQLGAAVLDGEVHVEAPVRLPLRTMNRHGLISGATGTGKSKTLALIAEGLSELGVPVLLMDVKGDMSGLAVSGTDAPEGIRGDSANNVQKAIILETGITVQAPLFIKTGEKIKVDTRTGKYMERA